MIKFCIDKDDRKILSEIISEIAELLYKNDFIDGVLMNTYLFNKHPFKNDFSPVKDGINIELNILISDIIPFMKISSGEVKVISEKLDELRRIIYEKTNVNIIWGHMNTSILESENEFNNLDRNLNDGEILFDKTGELTKRKTLALFNGKSYPNSVQFEPELLLKKEFGG